MPRIVVFDVPHETEVSVLAILAEALKFVVSDLMECPSSWVTTSFPRDLVPPAGEDCLVIVYTGMTVDMSAAQKQRLTFNIAAEVRNILLIPGEVECFVVPADRESISIII